MPVAYVRMSRATVRVAAIKWKVGRETGGQKLESPDSVVRNELAEVEFEIKDRNLMMETYKRFDEFGRVIIMEANMLLMVGCVCMCMCICV